MSKVGIMPDEASYVGRNCICLPLQQAARVIGRHFDEALRPLDLTNWQFSLLMQAVGHGALSIGELAEKLATDRTTITANLKPLERRGLVEIRRDESDGRARRVIITRAGTRLMKSAYEIWTEANAEALKKLAGMSVLQLRGGLSALAS
jgi:DNA-binding MarR family transcriptional regulator